MIARPVRLGFSEATWHTGTYLTPFVLVCCLLTSCVGAEEDLPTGNEPPPRPFCIPAPPGLVSWWPGDASNRDVVGTNHVTLENGSTYAPGMVDQGFSLDAEDDFVGAEADGIGALQQLSIEAWVKLDVLRSTPQRIVTLGDEKAVILRFDTDLQFFMRIDGSFVTVSVSDALQLGVFHHLVATYNGRAMKLFVDGVRVGARAVSGASQLTDFLHFGGNDVPLGGIVDEVTIYDHPLSLAEIQAIYEAGDAGKCIP